MYSAEEFLRAVVTTPEGYLGMAVGNGQWWEETFFDYPAARDDGRIASYIERYRDETNVYVCPVLFSSRVRRREFALPTRTITQDLDEAPLDQVPLLPSLLLATSRGAGWQRHQGAWTIKEEEGYPDLEVVETLSRKLAYATPGCDTSGWPITRVVRLPGTYNYKYLEGPQEVVVATASMRQYTVADLELLPEVPPLTSTNEDDAWIDNPPFIDMGPQQLFAALRADYKEKLPARVVTQYNVRMPDRSAALWVLMTSLFRCGTPRDQVFWLAKHSANNKFADLRYYADRELAKDVLRAERASQVDHSDIKSKIGIARRMTSHTTDKRNQIYRLTLNDMQDKGEFLRTRDDAAYYVRADLGRPIQIAARSEYLNSLLDIHYGLNATEADHNHVTASLQAHAKTLPMTGVSAALSHYLPEANLMLLHTGKREVLAVTPTAIQATTNGSYGVVFPWLASMEPFAPRLGSELDWGEILYGSSLKHVIDIPRDAALALLKVWTLFVLFRSASVSRPILALFGQPGSGKSTIFRKVYALFYGAGRALQDATAGPESFDQATSSNPLVVLDNVDTYEKWVPDRLALSAANSDFDRRKLYTDVDTITMRRQAIVAVSAHNPRFGREDVMDRLLLITLGRYEDDEFRDETTIISEVLSQRNALWGSMVADVSRVLATPMPADDEVPPFRVQDFARIGLRIARGLGIEAPFRTALDTVKSGTKTFILGEETILVEAIKAMVSSPSYSAEPLPVAKLYTKLEAASGDPQAFTRYYKSAMALSKKLWVLQATLKQIVDVEWSYDLAQGSRQWKIGPKGT